MTDLWDRALRAALGPARELAPTDDELQRVIALDRARSRATRRPGRAMKFAIAAGLAVVVGTGTYAVPATRAAIDDVYGAMTDWIASDDQSGAPGRALGPQEDAPDWVRNSGGAKRLVAENAGARLYVFQESNGNLSVALGNSIGISDSVEGWRRQLAEHKVVVLGPGDFPGPTESQGRPLDAQDRRPLFGLTAKTVTRVELRYDRGAPTTQTGLSGGFVLLADARRRPRAIVAYDGAGREIERIDAGPYDLRVCREMRGCPPGHYEPVGTDDLY